VQLKGIKGKRLKIDQNKKIRSPWTKQQKERESKETSF
jgi:hypothetical protein